MRHWVLQWLVEHDLGCFVCLVSSPVGSFWVVSRRGRHLMYWIWVGASTPCAGRADKILVFCPSMSNSKYNVRSACILSTPRNHRSFHSSQLSDRPRRCQRIEHAVRSDGVCTYNIQPTPGFIAQAPAVEHPQYMCSITSRVLKRLYTPNTTPTDPKWHSVSPSHRSYVRVVRIIGISARCSEKAGEER